MEQSPDPAIIFNTDNSIYVEYFRLTEHFCKKYGANTVILIQVGAFFEIYATKDHVTGVISRSKIEEVCIICGGLSIAEKKYTHGTSQVVMAGFRDYNIDRYVQSIVDANYTVVLYTQKELETGRLTREHSGTFSPGTFLSADADTAPRMSNNVLCLWIDRYTPFLKKSERMGAKSANQSNIVCGAAVVNIFTGESVLFEYETALEMVPATFDALERFVSTHAPSETIFVSAFTDEADSRRVLQYIGVNSRVVHIVPQPAKSSSDSSVVSASTAGSMAIDSSAIERCRQQKYIRHILASFFREDTYDICEEFRQYVVATQSYVYLLNFIQERNPNLVRKIVLPRFDNKSTNMVLANHTLRQLNIIEDGMASDDSASSQLRSVGEFLNKCRSAIGRRRFYNQLVHPVFDEVWLNREYDAISTFLENYEMVDGFRRLIREVADLEKIARQLVSRKLYPDSVARLYKSVLSIQQIHVCLLESDDLCRYFIECQPAENPHTVISSWIKAVLDMISSNLIVEKCEGCNSVTAFEDNIVRPGTNAELDALLLRMDENEQLFQEIRKTFNTIMSKIDGPKNGAATDYVRVHETEKMGSSLHLTKKRSAALKKYLAELVRREVDAKIILSFGKTKIPIPVAEIRLMSAGTTADAIEFGLIDRITREKLTIRDTINTTISKAYSRFLDNFETDCLSVVERLANFVARVDVLQSKAYAAKTHGYCRPQIDILSTTAASNSSQSYVEATDLRHCLIEHIQTQELYVANNISLAASKQDPTGILLYGTNAVGKTSFIRALGIAVIMAQSGMYVPCTKFVFKPYRSIFTRILGNDNLFKNLSMFAVEMSELRVILNSADKNSLVLGDELCSGTETESALSIFASGLTELHEKGATFLFATHFHEILKFSEIKALGRVAVKHMAVHYDRVKDCLVYDRVLRDGPGNRLYGLEVAKSLHLPDEFIERAYTIRNKYFPEMRGDLSASPSRYNAKKIRGVCENCREELAEEVHHLQEQQLADETGRIGTIHKNHPANLMGLCEKCHRATHQSSPPTESKAVKQTGKPKIVRKKTTAGYIVETSPTDVL